MYHGHYEQHQYLPIAITWAENDAVVLIGLRHGTCHASLGVDDDLQYLAGRLRAVWPDVQITVRGDGGFATPLMYKTCDDLRMTFTIGLGMNPRLKKISEYLLAQVVKTYAETQAPQRLFLPVSARPSSAFVPPQSRAANQPVLSRNPGSRHRRNFTLGEGESARAISRLGPESQSSGRAGRI